MEKIKVIDLLNKIANGEEVPKKIKWNNKIYISKGNAIENFVDYISDDDDYCFEHYIGYSSLNEEVEIIEEDKKIEKLELVNNGNVNAYALLDDWGTKCALTKHSKIMVDKINEIIDKLNKEE